MVSRPLLEVGRVVKPHGLRGEVVVVLVTNRLERLEPGSRLALAGTVGAAPTPDRELEVVSSRPFRDRFLVRFQGVEDLEGAEALRGGRLSAEPIEDPEALFVHELIGSEVVETNGTSRGLVTGVEANPASDLLVVEERALVPLRFVVERQPGRVVVEVPEGLFD